MSLFQGILFYFLLLVSQTCWFRLLCFVLGSSFKNWFYLLFSVFDDAIGLFLFKLEQLDASVQSLDIELNLLPALSDLANSEPRVTLAFSVVKFQCKFRFVVWEQRLLSLRALNFYRIWMPARIHLAFEALVLRKQWHFSCIALLALEYLLRIGDDFHLINIFLKNRVLYETSAFRPFAGRLAHWLIIWHVNLRRRHFVSVDVKE